MSSDGISFEKLVQLIEQSINPEAKVEHDVQMPILTSQKGATTQCDVVITTGNPPRETITIIEVQDRDSKPAANDFRGWQQKLDDVGAQHLICVSRKGFTESEIERASQSGNRIRLVTLSELDTESIPLNFFEMYFDFENFDIKPIGDVALTLSGSDQKKYGIEEKASIGKKDDILNEKLFSEDKKEIVSLYDLCKKYVTPQKEIDSGKNRLEFLQDQNHIFYLIDGHFVRCELKFEYEWIYEHVHIPASILAYEQNEFGTLVWVLKAGYESKNGYVGFSIPVTKLEDGSGYEMKGFEVKAPSEQIFEFTLYRNYKSPN